MAQHKLKLELVACEFSVEDLLDLFGDTLNFYSISGTVNTKHRDYAAEDIMLSLQERGRCGNQRAEHLADDGASMLSLDITVPDSERERVERWIKYHIEDPMPGAIEWSGRTITAGDVEGLSNSTFAIETELLTARHILHRSVITELDDILKNIDTSMEKLKERVKKLNP